MAALLGLAVLVPVRSNLATMLYPASKPKAARCTFCLLVLFYSAQLSLPCAYPPTSPHHLCLVKSPTRHVCYSGIATNMELLLQRGAQLDSGAMSPCALTSGTSGHHFAGSVAPSGFQTQQGDCPVLLLRVACKVRPLPFRTGRRRFQP